MSKKRLQNIKHIYLLTAICIFISKEAHSQICGQISRSLSCSDAAVNFVGLYVGEGVGIGRANLRVNDVDAIAYKNAMAGRFEIGYNWPLETYDHVLGIVANYSAIRPTTVNTSIGKQEIGNVTYGISFLAGIPNGRSLTYAKLGFGRLNSVGSNKYHNQNFIFALGYEYKYNNNWSFDAEFESSVPNGRNVSKNTPIPTSRAFTLGMRYYLESDETSRKSSSEEIVYQDPPPAKKDLFQNQALIIPKSSATANFTPPPIINTPEETSTPNAPTIQASTTTSTLAKSPRNEALVLPSDDFFTWRTKYAIQPAGKEALNILSNKLKNISFDRINIVSHTDIRDAKDFKKVPKGAITRETQQTDNNTITKIRAESIRDFLAKEAENKIPMEKLFADGKGSQLAKLSKVCTAKKKNLNPKEMANCMAGDRRIVIDIIGIRS